MPLIKDIKAGSDPEVFIVDPSGKFVPSFDMLGGSKFNPRPMGRPGFFVQEDNVALEYNIPPASTVEEFVLNIFDGFELAKKMLPPGHNLKVQASARFTRAQLRHPKADEFGCEPDKNAWTEDFNERPAIPKNGLRATGGHFHIGYTLEDLNGPYTTDINIQLAKWCDIYLAVPFMKIDKDLNRRKIYGKAGAYRDKVYGMEYRSLSSEWLRSRELAAWVYNQAMMAVARVNEGLKPDEKDKNHVLAAVNKNNKRSINYLVDKYELKYAV